MFKVNKRNTRKDAYSKPTIKIEQRHCPCSGVFIVNFEHILHLFTSVSIGNFEKVNVNWDLFTVNNRQTRTLTQTSLWIPYCQCIWTTCTHIYEYFYREIWTYPVGIYMFKVNNRNTNTRCEMCSQLTIKHQNDVIGVALVSLLLTLNIFYTLF